MKLLPEDVTVADASLGVARRKSYRALRCGELMEIDVALLYLSASDRFSADWCLRYYTSSPTMRCDWTVAPTPARLAPRIDRLIAL